MRRERVSWRLVVVPLVVGVVLGAFCSCDESWPTHDVCQGVRCSGHGSCFTDGFTPICSCDDGTHPSGLACLENNPTNPCEGVLCNGRGECVVEEDLPVCDCDDGYEAAANDLLCLLASGERPWSPGVLCDPEQDATRSECWNEQTSLLLCNDEGLVEEVACDDACVIHGGLCWYDSERERDWCECPEGPCPLGMTYLIELDICIDRYEASYGAGGVAASVDERYPWTQIDWESAAAACLLAGKRLCTAEEWLMACGGPGEWRYPYGYDYEPGRCVDSSLELLDPLPTGSATECEGYYLGLMDMSGNVSEWTSSLHEGNPLVAVGSLTDGAVRQECNSWVVIPATEDFDDLGFRCCLTP